MNVLITNAEVGGGRRDVRIVDGVVAEVASGLTGVPADEVVDADGGALIPGLHDHHLHLNAMAAAALSVPCGPPSVTRIDELRAALDAAPGTDWIRGVGYHESVAGPLGRDALDRLVRRRPVRIQHRSGGLWMLNSKAIERLGLDVSDGRVWRGDHLMRIANESPPDLTDIGHDLLQLGITGVTDATPDLDARTLGHLEFSVASGALPQSVMVLGAPDGWRSEHLLVGPRKLLLHDHDLPSYEALAARVRASHESGRPVAVHCVTRESLMLTLAVLDDVGAVAGDRIEHAAVVPPEVRENLATLGVRVVTQPRFIAERGDDYLRDVAPDDLECLYPYGELLAAGIRVAPSSDAPYTDPDPWRVMAAARDRMTASGARVNVEPGVEVATSLRGYLSDATDPGGPPRTITVGARADLCLLHVPLATAMRQPSRDDVRLTICGTTSSSRDEPDICR